MAKPEPMAPPDEAEATHSGRLLLRMPPSLHAELARAAREEGVSLNAFIGNVLAGAVRWRAPGETPRPANGNGRLLRIALIADVVLVAVAAVLAIVLLVVAWL